MESPSASPHSAGEPGKQNNLVTISPTLEPGMQIPMSRAQHNFTLFPQFPFEIREMIWSAAIEPRSVKITIPRVEDYTNSELEYHYNRSRELYRKPKAKPPPSSGLAPYLPRSPTDWPQAYHLSFSDHLDNKPIYFNFEFDTLLFKGSGTFWVFCAILTQWRDVSWKSRDSPLACQG
jgi:hypothetical protein